MYALAKLGQSGGPLCDAACRTATASLSGYKWQEVCNLLWAFSTFRCVPHSLLSAVEERLRREAGGRSLRGPDWASLIWAFATLVCASI
jgi:hypothetical protein